METINFKNMQNFIYVKYNNMTLKHTMNHFNIMSESNKQTRF